MKRLYVVQVEFEYAVMAESASEACSFARDCAGDLDLEQHAYASQLQIVEATDHLGIKRNVPMLPEGWTGDALVYGADKDTTLDDAVEAERGLQGEP